MKIDHLIEVDPVKHILEKNRRLAEIAKGKEPTTRNPEEISLNIKGFKGDMGPTGPRGEIGQMGARGPEGKPGKDGEPGENGIDGRATFISQGVPKMTASDGDSCIDSVTGDLYEYNEQWVKVGNLKGPKGDKGPKGEKGAKGERGEPGLTGAIGNDGAQGPQGVMGPPGVGATITDTSTYVSPTLISTIVNVPSSIRGRLFVKSMGGPVVVSSITAVANENKELLIFGCSDTDTVELNDGANLKLNGAIVLKNGSQICLHEVNGINKWVEAYRNEI